jgi:uncharacterized protein YebE (UPF0316 family)
MTWPGVLWAVLIFASRVVDVGLGTIRVQLIVRRRKWLASLVGFVEILIYILVVSRVIQDIGNWLNVIAYAGGFATGTVVGMALSERMSRGVVEATIITRGPWQELEDALRQAGFALTRHSGVGREGRVEVLTVVSRARDLARLVDLVTAVDAGAFVYARELAGLRGGYVYGVKSKL